MSSGDSTQRRLRVGIGRLALGLLVLSLLLVAWRLFAPISTPPFKDASGKPLHDSIAVVERWPVNGTVQSVVIRSRDLRNPILIWLHGGPGNGETPVLRRFNGALEDQFTVVYWDQRYAGQSYDPFLPVPKDLTIAQYVRDLDVIVDVLRSRFHQQKVFLVGQSWGTAVGTLYAGAHPEKVFAYVGVGQVVNTVENEALSYRFVLYAARARRDASAIRRLEEIGPPPRKSGSIFTPRDLVAKYGGFSHSDLSLNRLILLSLTSPETNWRDVAALFGAQRYSQGMLNGEFTRLALDRDAATFRVPIFILAGRYDHMSEAQLAHSYYARLSAPRKQFLWFENSAHNPNLEEPERFDAFMFNDIRPIADHTGG
jgi:proline iminopeptidase